MANIVAFGRKKSTVAGGGTAKILQKGKGTRLFRMVNPW
jgi:hypothetical protein